MPFCPKCGYQLKENDQFCFKCGYKLEEERANGASNLGNITANAEELSKETEEKLPKETELIVECVASNPKACMRLELNRQGKNNPVLRPGDRIRIPMEEGAISFRYVVDRGPGFTFVASRNTTYSQRLVFHEGEAIRMIASIGRQVTRVNFESDMGYHII